MTWVVSGLSLVARRPGRPLQWLPLPLLRLPLLLTCAISLLLVFTCACSGGSDGGGGPADGCVPTTCSAQGKDCGDITDGCGDVINCGACGSGETCGGGGVLNVCGTATGDITVVVAPSRTTGVAPLAVFFDASGTTGLEGGDFLSASFSWDFGDPVAGEWSTTGLSRNTATGFLAAHVFETPGTYTVTVTVIDRTGRAAAPATVSIEATDPEQTYLGDRTRCVSRNGDFTDAPAGAELLTSSDLDAQVEWVNGEANRRLLFRRGETWNDVIAHFTGNGPNTVGAFGPGDDPRFLLAPDAEAARSVSTSGVDMRIMDLELDASGLPDHGEPGSDAMGQSGSENLAARLYIHDAGSTGHGAGGDYNYLYECVVEDNGYFSSYIDGVGNAVMGSRIHQLRIATSFIRPADSRDMYVAHNLIDASREAPTCAIKWHSRRGVITDNLLTAGTGRFCSGESGEGWEHPVNRNLGVVLIERNTLVPSSNPANNPYNSNGIDLHNSHMMVRNNLLYEMNTAFGGNYQDLVVDDIHILNNTVFVSAEAVGLNIGNGDMFIITVQTTNWEIRNNIIHSLNGPGTASSGSSSQRPA